ncbi:MAG: ROK family transcriptional regulator [Ruminococcaceae bacterium]|nr:ROK family transcriptional regulator [Oscillospiraceae bacterium]
MKPENNADRKRATRNSVYHYLYNCRDFCSRQILANELGLSLPTVYQNLAELMELGLVCATDEKLSTGGRRVEGLSIVEDARFAVGVSVSDDALRISAVDLRLNELAYKKVSMRHPDDRMIYAEQIRGELERFIDELGAERSRLLGVGIAFPGIVSKDGMTLEYAPTLGLRNFSLKEFKEGLPYEIHIENDANCGGGAERFARGGKENIAYLSIEEGIGGAVFTNGMPYFGDNHRSGEFGHICVEPGGLRCSCGRQGCLEAYCSSRRISTDLGITLEDFFASIQNIDFYMKWESYLYHLAVGINSIRMVLDCDVVLGGFMTEYLADSMPRLKEYLASLNSFERSADYVHLSRQRKHAIPMGATLYFITKFLEEL